MNHDAIAAELHNYADEKYRSFSSRLLPGVCDILGVRLPELQRMARRLAAGDWRAYLETARDDSFEERMLQGLTLGHAKASVEEKAPYIARFVGKIDNWSVCDSFCSALKSAKTEPEAMLALIDEYLPSHNTYAARFAVVQLLMYYMDGIHLDASLERLLRVRAQEEPVQMAVAWALSIAYREDAGRTLRFLEERALSPFVRRKAYQKMIELSSTTPQERERLRALRDDGGLRIVHNC